MNGPSSRDLTGDHVRGVPEVRRHLKGKLPAALERRAHAGQEVEMVVDPLQRCVGKDQVEIFAQPCGDVVLRKGETTDVRVVLLGPLEHGYR